MQVIFREELFDVARRVESGNGQYELMPNEAELIDETAATLAGLSRYALNGYFRCEAEGVQGQQLDESGEELGNGFITPEGEVLDINHLRYIDFESRDLLTNDRIFSSLWVVGFASTKLGDTDPQPYKIYVPLRPTVKLHIPGLLKFPHNSFLERLPKMGPV